MKYIVRNTRIMKHLIFGLSLIFLMGLQSCNEAEIPNGDKVIEKIEKYKKEHSEPPVSMNDIGMDKDSGPFHYDRLDDEHYQLFYVDESEDVWLYNSVDKEWNYCSDCKDLFK